MNHWFSRIRIGLEAFCFAAVVVIFVPSLTDPLTRPVLSFLTAPADQGERTYSTSGIDDPKQTVQEQTVTENREPYLPFLTTGFVGGRQRQIEPNYQYLSSLDRAASVAKMALSTGQVRFRVKGSDKTFHCSGTLISDKYILTAAHCFFYSADSDAGDFVRRAEITDIRFDLGPIDGENPAEVMLGVYPKPREMVCPRHYAGRDCDKGPTDGYDYAILELWPDAEQDRYRKTLRPDAPLAPNWTMQQARNLGYRPARLADVPIISRHQMMLSHFPAISAHMVTERHCQGTQNPVSPERDLIKHVCDTQGGSSGGAVFSRDHEAMIAMHIRGSKIFNETERQAETEANHALLITAIARVSKIIGREVEVLDHPPTTEQQAAIDYANKRGEEAERLAAQGRHTAATYVALDGLERFVGRKDDEDYLFSHAAPAQGALINAVDEQKELMQLKHEGSVSSAAFSPDGKLLVTASGKIARIWDVRTGVELRERRLIGHDGDIRSVAFSRDGSLIVTGSYDKTARLWNARTGKEYSDRRMILTGIDNLIVYNLSSPVTASFSPNGDLIVTAAGNTAQIWDARTGKEFEERRLVGHGDLVTSAAFNSEGSLIVTASYDQTARIWDVRTGKEIKSRRLVGHSQSLESAVFSPGGAIIVTTSFLERTVRFWDALTGKEIRERRIAGLEGFTAAAFNRDGTLIVTAGAAARVWNVQTGQEITSRRLQGGDQLISSAAFSPDGSLVVTTGYENARLWDARAVLDAQVPRLLKHDIRDFRFMDMWTLPGRVGRAIFSPDSSLVLTVPNDKTARVWDLSTGREIESRRLVHEGNVSQAAFSPNGKLIVTVSEDNRTKRPSDWRYTMRIWDLETGNEIKARRHVGHTEFVTSAAFRPDGVLIVTASLDKTVRFWDVLTGKEIKALRLVHDDDVRSAAFSPDGDIVVTASGNTARVWDARTGRENKALRLVHDDLVESAAFSPDGMQVVTVSGRFFSGEPTVKVWDALTGQEIRSRRLVGHGDAVNRVGFSSDGKLFLTASMDGTARLWDARSGREIRGRRLAVHDDRVTDAAFSRDGSLIVTASGKDARIIETPSTGRALINQAYCRIRRVRPSAAECSSLGLRCDLRRVPSGKCEDLMPRVSALN